MIVGLVFGLERLVSDPLTRELTLVVLLWHCFNFVLVLGALATIVERRQTRIVPRIAAADRVVLEGDRGQLLLARLDDVSEGGCSVSLDEADPVTIGAPLPLAAVHALAPDGDTVWRIPVRSQGAVTGRGELRCAFNAQTESEHRAVVLFARGDERRFEALRRRRQRPLSYLRSLGMLFGSAGRPLGDHALLVLRHWWSRLFRGKQNYV